MGQRWAAAIRFIGIGWYIVSCILLGALGGRWIGQKLDGETGAIIFTLLGLALGLIAAFLGAYRLVKSLLLNNNRDKKQG